ncbi:MAG: amidohydrolase [Desulfatibacillaceae bacterium]|nr:amidohydrolase [Desulfatibacillaceae bacterium]
MSFDLVIENGIVITLNKNNEIIANGAVGIKASSIAAVGKTGEVDKAGAAKVLDAKGGIIMPGFVNAHTHAAMTLFRGLADDLPLMDWLNNHIFPAEATLNRNMVYAGTMLACAEMILSGTTCFCDMYLFEDAVAQAADDAQMRAVVGEVLYDFPSPNYGPIEKGFEFTEMLLEKYKAHPRVSIAVEPHSPYLCAPAILQKSADLAQKWNAPVIIHVSETKAEVAQMLEKYGKTPVAHLADLGFLSPRVVADHCVVLTDDDINLLAKNSVKVAINPESNMKLASGTAPVKELMAAGVCVALGTDGCASNNDLDMIGEMDTAAKVHKVVTEDPTVMKAQTALELATINGARALGMESLIGSIEKGKLADIIVVDTAKPHLTPMYNPVSHLVYAARGSDVAHSVIHGRLVMENRQLLFLDVEKAMADVRQLARIIRP